MPEGRLREVWATSIARDELTTLDGNVPDVVAADLSTRLILQNDGAPILRQSLRQGEMFGVSHDKTCLCILFFSGS